MLHAHTLLIAAIFVPYVVLMAALGLYMWGQVRRHLKDSGEDERDSSDTAGPGDVLLAA